MGAELGGEISENDYSAMTRLLISWIGRTDLNAATVDASGDGPLLATLREVRPDISFLLYN